MLSELLEGESGEEPEEVDDEVEAAPRPTATLDQLKKKKRVIKTANVVVSDDDGEPMEVSLTFQGIPAHEYDALVAKFPPRPQDKKQGLGFHPDKFGPALLAATCIEPKMTVEDAKEIWESESWNRGERMMLFMTAVEVCTIGLNVPFKKRVFG